MTGVQTCALPISLVFLSENNPRLSEYMLDTIKPDREIKEKLLHTSRVIGFFPVAKSACEFDYLVICRADPAVYDTIDLRAYHKTNPILFSVENRKPHTRQ